MHWKYNPNLEKSILYLKDCNIFVLAYLTDGWGDVLFTFRKDERHELSETNIDAMQVLGHFETTIERILVTPGNDSKS